MQLSKPLFGKEVSIITDAPDLLAEDILENAYSYGLKLQKIFNFYDEKSELSILNKKRELVVSNELLSVIKSALSLSKSSSGLYDISLGKQFLQRKSHLPISKVDCSYNDIKISGNKVSLTHPDVLIDLGSIAKGYIADKIGEYLNEEGLESFIVDARGDIVVFGKPQIIPIQHPRSPIQFISSIKVSNAGIATSGDYNQYHQSPSNSHIINQNDICSITVIAKTLVEADGFATALFVLPEKERIALIKENPQIQVLTIDKELNQKYYNGFNKLIIEEKKR